ncbi:MAG: TIGR02391 family protein [Chloroflexota bacterium]
MPDIDLAPEERLLLELVYAHFDRDDAQFNRDQVWPESSAIKRQLYQRGYKKLVMDDLMARLAPELVREVEFSGRRLRLTLRGFPAIYRMIELNDFICFLRLGLEKYGQHVADKKVSTADVVQRCGTDAKRLRKLDALLEAEIYIAHASARAPDGGPFEWEIDDEITRYEDVFSIDEYLVARSRELEALARADIPPVHLLAAEGISFGHALEVVEPSSAQPVEPPPPQTLGDFIADPELRERCGDLLLAGGKFDRAIREAAVVLEDRVRAAVGGSDKVGVPLMEYAFGAADPRLRLSLNQREQLGAMQLYAGVMAFFRNPTGHSLKDTYTREDAVRFVAMVDLLLQIIARADRLPSP